jgi:hypothetical protein
LHFILKTYFDSSEDKEKINHFFGQQNTFHVCAPSHLLSSRNRVPWGRLWVCNPSLPGFPPVPEPIFSLGFLKNLEQRLKKKQEENENWVTDLIRTGAFIDFPVYMKG